MKSKIYLIIIIICFIPFTLKSENDFVSTNLKIQLNNDKNITFKNIEEDEIIKGTLYGNIISSEDSNFNDANLECDFIGRSYKGRGFSCGFAVIEDLQGFCYIKDENNKGTLITSWNCNTTAAFNGDPNCSGKLNIIQGFGLFAGVAGYGKINMPLAKSIKSQISFPMSLNIKIKYPLSLKKSQLN